MKHVSQYNKRISFFIAKFVNNVWKSSYNLSFYDFKISLMLFIFQKDWKKECAAYGIVLDLWDFIPCFCLSMSPFRTSNWTASNGYLFTNLYNFWVFYWPYLVHTISSITITYGRKNTWEGIWEVLCHLTYHWYVTMSCLRWISFK